jgi:hypothetical protein
LVTDLDSPLRTISCTELLQEDIIAVVVFGAAVATAAETAEDDKSAGIRFSALLFEHSSTSK